MAKARAPEASSSRDRVPPPPRLSGPGIAQIAMIGGLGAVLLAFLGVFLATQSSDPTAERNADQLGAALCAVLTAPDPDWWDKDHGKWDEMRKRVWREIPEAGDFPALPKAKLDQIYGKDFVVEQRNTKRLENAAEAAGVFAGGIVKGMMVRFTRGDRTSHYTGARIDPGSFQTTHRVGAGVDVGIMSASDAMGAGSFRARVYHRTYNHPVEGPVGDVYVILAQSALEGGGGGGLWIALTPLLVAVAAGFVILQANKVSEGLRNVGRDLETIGRGKLDHRISVTGAGEVAWLQRMTDRMAKNLALIQSTGSGDLDEALEKELDLANQIHQSLRPSDPPRVPGFELETLFKPGREVGGDYFDYIELDANHLALVMADCSENLRGVPAAMVMAMTRAYLQAAIEPDSTPGDWLKWVNRRLARDLKSGMFVTALVALVDTSSGEVIAASAGHRPIVMWRGGKTAQINPNGIALGLDVGPVFDKTLEEKKFTMQKNDRIVFYTDGVLSAENEGGEKYGEDRFLDSIRRQGAMNSAAFVNFVAGAVDKFLGGVEQNDDVTISTLKRMK